MTNRQLTLSGIDRVEDLHFTPLEKSYLKAQLIKTLLSWRLRSCSSPGKRSAIAIK